jgi:hypothetical protein
MRAAGSRPPRLAFVVTRAALTLVLTLAACVPAPSPAPSGGPTPAPSPTAGGQPCPFAEQSGPLFTNTLVDVEVDSDGLTDRVTFTLGEPAFMIQNPTGTLRAVEPPFIEDGSGEEVDVLGEHHLELRMDPMSMFDEAGEPTFIGEGTITPAMLSLRQVELTGAFEGIFLFVIGYDGAGCVALTSDEATRTITIAIGH